MYCIYSTGYTSTNRGYYWIGLKRNDNNQWEWVDGTPFGGYTKWATSEGSNSHEQCAEYLKDTTNYNSNSNPYGSYYGSYYGYYGYGSSINGVRGNFWRDQQCGLTSKHGFICNDNSTTELISLKYIEYIGNILCYYVINLGLL